MNKITEIVPDDLPEWAQTSFDNGRFFKVAVEKVSFLEKELQRHGKTEQIHIENLERLLEYEKHQKMCVILSVLRPMTNGEWKELKRRDSSLFDFIKNAINLADT